MEYTPVLRTKFNQCNKELKVLFMELLDKGTIYCISHSAVNMKEFHYSLRKEYKMARVSKIKNFCLFTLTPFRNGITIHLRTGTKTISSDILKLDFTEKLSYLSGVGWTKFCIRSNSDLGEALRLIKEIYECKE